jgi:hypothetical protein
LNVYLPYIFIINAYNPVYQETMPRFSPEVCSTAIVTLMVLFSPDIPFWIQLYLESKNSHGDIDAYVDKKHRDAIRSHFGSDPTFVEHPAGDKHRDRVTITVDGVDVLIEFKYSEHPEASAFAGSYGGFFHILLLHSLRGVYGQHVSIVDGYVVFTEGKVVVQIMTLHEFLVRHNFIHSTSQDHAFLDIDALFDAWSKSTCFYPSYVIHAFQKTKKRDERTMGMYNAFTAWLSSNGFNVEELLEEPAVSKEQCQNNAEKAFSEAWLRFQQALDAEKEAVKRIEDAKKTASVSSIIALGAIGSIEKTQIPLVASLSRFLQGTQNEGDKKHSTCQKCIALHEKFKAMHGGGDIFSAITNTVGKGAWVEYVKRMWDVYNGITTEEE